VSEHRGYVIMLAHSFATTWTCRIIVQNATLDMPNYCSGGS
jgi:hypothetical protein